MRKLLSTIWLVALLAGCGEPAAEPKPAPAVAASQVTPEPHSDASHEQLTANAEKESLRGYSKGVRDYYGEEAVTKPVGDEHIDIEIEYHQPPRPGETEVGKPITLTGTNIGVRAKVTVGKVRTAGSYTVVDLELENTGIAVHDDALRNAAITYDDGKTVLVNATELSCSNGFDGVVRIDALRRKKGCLAFARSGNAEPKQLQLSLENVPVTAGGIWDVR